MSRPDVRRWSWLLAFVLVATACGSSSEVIVFPTPTPIVSDTTDEVPDDGDDIPASTTEDDATFNTVRDADVQAASFDIRQCDYEIPEGIDFECKWFHVPYAHWDKNSPDLHLSMTLLKSPNPNAPADPVVYISGGPGYPGGNPEVWATSPILEDRDIIVFDQRGTGLSEIDMDCVEIESVVIESLATADPFEEERARMRDAAVSCYDDLRARGAYLNGFDTTSSAHDLEALRLGLGYDQWNLFGISYGTRLALEYMRVHPEGVRSVILDSAYPTTAPGPSALAENSDRAVIALSNACAADPVCGADHPDLWSEVLDVVARYDANPAQVSVVIDGATVNLTITGADLYAGLFNAMYDTDLIPQIPDIVGALAAGNTALAGPIAEQGIEFVTGANEAMAISTECGDRPTDRDPQPLADLLASPGRHSTLLLLAPSAACEWWDVARAWEGFGDAVVSDIPTLVTAGSLDPVTPPSYSQAAAEALTNATYVEFGHNGHGAVFGSACGIALARAHLANPTAALNTACVDAYAAPTFS